MKQTNFDRYLKEQLADPAVARRFKQAGQAWEVALQIAALRQRAGLSQKEVAHRAGGNCSGHRHGRNTRPLSYQAGPVQPIRPRQESPELTGLAAGLI